ncbi:MAG: uroporphyrinogen-III C-methyltransferase [Ornithinimicrobium sp.]
MSANAVTMFGLDLTGRWVVAVGGGAVSTRRVKDLLQRGARVRLVSPEASPELRQLIADDAITWVPRVYVGSPDLAGAWLVHTATGMPKVDARVARDAESTRIWCINAGDAAAGSARTPARACLDTPDGPVELAVTAAGDPRRATAVAASVGAALETGRIDTRRRRPRPGTGWVALVGGGPGSDGLLTVRGAQLLAAADVVVVDRLAPRRLLADLPEDVEVIDVGKEVGRHAVPQGRINEILVEQALAGRGVVRLKGGDPYILGRGGEELLACAQAGVEVEVVSGVTSAVAVPAAAGIPLTHRGVARGFTVVTGHDEIAELPTGGDHTVVVLMGVARLREAARAMVAAGRSADTPAAVIERGLLPGQRTTVGTLDQIAEQASRIGVRSPAVIVIGDVVRLSPAWRDANVSAASVPAHA